MPIEAQAVAALLRAFPSKSDTCYERAPGVADKRAKRVKVPAPLPL